MPEIQIDWHSQEEADRLQDLRDRHGMVWRGVLLEGAKHAESIDLFKALLELHPELATPLPTQHDGVNPKRTAATEQLREQILQRQHERSTTDLPVSAFTNWDGEADSDTAGDWRGGSDENAPRPEHETQADADPCTENSDGTQSIDVTSTVARMQEARAARTHQVQRSVAAEGTRARNYEQWDVAEVRTVDADGEGAELLHPLDAHEDAEDELRRPDDDEDVIDPRYEYGYADGGSY